MTRKKPATLAHKFVNMVDTPFVGLARFSLRLSAIGTACLLFGSMLAWVNGRYISTFVTIPIQHSADTLVAAIRLERSERIAGNDAILEQIRAVRINQDAQLMAEVSHSFYPRVVADSVWGASVRDRASLHTTVDSIARVLRAMASRRMTPQRSP